MLPLPALLDHLASVYGEPEPPTRRGLFELLVLENVVYLADDATRERALSELRAHIGLSPEALLAAPDEALRAIAAGGILADNQVEKLRRIARLARELDGIERLPLAGARRVLMNFPSIGEPGAEKLLLFARLFPVLGLESNAVRVLTRVGLVVEARSYAATYREVQRLVEPFAERGFDWLIRAHQLLRQHGQELCRRSRPQCERCPLRTACDFYVGAVAAG